MASTVPHASSESSSQDARSKQSMSPSPASVQVSFLWVKLEKNSSHSATQTSWVELPGQSAFLAQEDSHHAPRPSPSRSSVFALSPSPTGVLTVQAGNSNASNRIEMRLF